MWIKLAAAFGFLGVALGAFGAHALRARLEPRLLEIWQTGVLYHLIHAVALLALALYARSSGSDIRWGAGLMTAGIVLFSFSLYALALTGISRLGAVTPFGGLCFLLAWGWIIWKMA